MMLSFGLHVTNLGVDYISTLHMAISVHWCRTYVGGREHQWFEMCYNFDGFNIHDA